jgi:uncharacterized repeat protein (TIGR01451 family)
MRLLPAPLLRSLAAIALLALVAWAGPARAGTTGSHRAPKDTADALAALGELELPAHSQITISFVATIDTPDPGELVVQNQAVVASNAAPPQFADVLTGDPDETGAGDPDDPTPTLLDVNADLAITKTDGVVTVIPGQALVYTIAASNAGPSGVADAVLTDTLPAALTGCTWTCTGSAGGLCGNGTASDSGAGDISEPVDLPVGGSVELSVSCTLDPAASGTVQNTASIVVPAGVDELDAADNQATDTDQVASLDWGDAPDPTYPTLAASNGARHILVPGVRLGALIDSDPDGQPSVGADGDDATGSDDEDGVSFDSSLIVCGTTGLTVTTSAAGALDAWIDLDGNGSWADPGEQVLVSEPLPAGTVSGLDITVPCDATPGTTYARFRFSTAGGLSFDGLAADGEVEDYQVSLVDDAEPPAITDIAMGTAGQTLPVSSCETVDRQVSRIEVAFSEEMRNTGGGTNPDDAANPSSYLLLGEAAPGAGFDTSTCGSGTGLDQVIPFAGVAYQDVTTTTGIDLASSLEDGVYRLLVCSSLVDTAGNPLGSGVDHRLDLRVEEGNLFINGHLDYCDSDPSSVPNLGGWTFTGGSPSDLEHVTDDADGSPLSGSARISNPSAATGHRLEQCVPAAAGQVYRLDGRLRLASPEYLAASATCVVYPAAGCTGTPLGTFGDTVLLPSTQGQWLAIGTPAGLVAPPGTMSAACGFSLTTPSGIAYTAELDRLELR